MSSDYDLVRSFDIPTNTLPILKAVTMASVLATACGPYSCLEHMCWFWAAVYMLIIQGELDRQEHAITVTQGKLWEDAGKSKRFDVRLVDAEAGRLCVDSFSATNVKKLFGHIYGERGDAALAQAQKDVDNYRQQAPQAANIQQNGLTSYNELLSFITVECEKLREQDVSFGYLSLPLILMLCFLAAEKGIIDSNGGR